MSSYISTSITSLKIEERERFVQSIAETLPDYIYVVDVRTRELLYKNREIVESLGYSDTELNHFGDDPFWKLVHPDDEQTARRNDFAFLLHLKDDEVFSWEYRLRRRDGSWCWFEDRRMVFARNADGTVQHMVGVSEDISLQKEAEAKLEALTRDLEHRVQERTLELSKAIELKEKSFEQLLQSERLSQLGELVAGVTHEINTPIGLSVTAATFLQARVRELESQITGHAPGVEVSRTQIMKEISAIREASDMVLGNVNRADEIIKAFKQMSVDQAAVKERSFRFADVIQQTLISLKPRTRTTPFKIHVDCDKRFSMTGVPGNFTQIVSNLVLNALIHGLQGFKEGTVSIRLIESSPSDIETAGLTISGAPANAAASDGALSRGYLSLTVDDDGRGIEPETARNIFEPFFTTKPNSGGTGLGLTVVQSIVTNQLHGSVVCVSPLTMDSERPGTRFLIVFPCN